MAPLEDAPVTEALLTRSYREIAVEAPAGALPPPMPVPEGMVAWRNRKNGFTVVACHYTADPEKKNDEWYTEACRNLREDQIERELEINFDSKAGAKAFPFLEYHQGLYMRDPPDPIPGNWKIIAGLDYGGRNPTAMIWFAVDEYRRFWAFDEFYIPMNKYEDEGGLPGFAEYIKGHRYYNRLRYIAADPSIFNKTQNVLETKETGGKSFGTLMSIADILIRQGVTKIQRGNNDRFAGISRLNQLINWRGDEKLTNPMIFWGKKCKKSWWEHINLVYKLDDKETVNAEEDVVKRNDHAFDATKYAALSVDAPAGAPHIDPRAGFATLKQVEDEIDEMHNKARGEDAFSCSFHELDDEFGDVENF